MDKSRFMDWIQILTAGAVFIGILMVIFELQQTKELAKLQIVSDGWASQMEFHRAQLSENFSQVRAKACWEPETLTNAEVMEMSQYNNLLLAGINRKREFESLGQTEVNTWEDIALINLSTWLSTKVGRADYLTMDVNEDMQSEIEKLISNNTIRDCREIYAGYLELIRDEDSLPIAKLLER